MNSRPRPGRRELLRHIERAKHGLIDWDLRVDDDRKDLNAALVRLQKDVRERNATERHLAYLLDLYLEIEDICETFGGEVADRHAAVIIAESATP